MAVPDMTHNFQHSGSLKTHQCLHGTCSMLTMQRTAPDRGSANASIGCALKESQSCAVAREASAMREASLPPSGSCAGQVRARTFYAEKAGLSVADVDVPVVGGHAGITILPLFSQATPGHSLDKATVEALLKRTQDGGTEVVQAKAGKVGICGLRAQGAVQGGRSAALQPAAGCTRCAAERPASGCWHVWLLEWFSAGPTDRIQQVCIEGEWPVPLIRGAEAGIGASYGLSASPPKQDLLAACLGSWTSLQRSTGQGCPGSHTAIGFFFLQWLLLYKVWPWALTWRRRWPHLRL